MSYNICHAFTDRPKIAQDWRDPNTVKLHNIIHSNKVNPALSLSQRVPPKRSWSWQFWSLEVFFTGKPQLGPFSGIKESS